MNLWARQLALGLLLTAAIPPAAVRAADSAGQGSGTPPPASAGSSSPAAEDAPPPLETTVKSADSDDLIGAPPAPQPAAPVQVASLPTNAAADGAGGTGAAPATAPAAAMPAANGNPHPQLAQLELAIPGPVGGYQPPLQQPDNGTPPVQDSLQLDIERSMKAIEAETSPMVEGGLIYRWREGTNGLSALNEVGFPIEGSFAPWLTGTMKLSVIPTWLDAGSVGGGFALSEFGTNDILAAKGLPTVIPTDQSVFGAIASLGYTYGPYSAKIGEVAWGFPVTNIIGDLAYQPKFLNDTLSVRFEALRQPVTDSLLSYAGTHASVTGANAATGGAFGPNGTWGGVTKTGGRVSVFYDDSNFGAFGAVGLANLDGTNVPENSTIDAVAGTYFRPYRSDHDALRVGVNLIYFGFDKNLSGFSFGQGGYFSPANYEALTFPVEYQGRSDRWSYLAAVALGVQHFNTNTSPFYPDNPFAQEQLVAAVGSGSAYYPGGSTTGLAADLRAQVEYAVANDLSFGAAAQYDNGHAYNEAILKLYVRKTFSDPPPITPILPGTPMRKPE